MLNEEKTNIVSLITTLGVSVPYMIFIVQKFQAQNLNTVEEIKFWAIAVLLLIPLRIVAEIIITIFASIVSTIFTGKDKSAPNDERDKLIELKSVRNSFYIFMIGFIISILAIVLDKSPTVMFVILIVSGFVCEIGGIVSKLYYYRRGF